MISAAAGTSTDDPPVVLVADDSATVRALVRYELEAAGYRVLEAEHGAAALEAVRGSRVDVLLLDVEMPVLDGHTTIAELKADPATADVPVVFLTARVGGDDVVEALRLGAQDYLRKPPEPAELLARVGAAVQVSQLRAELARRSRELDRMTRTDHLTGLFNRRHLEEVVQGVAASSRRHAQPYTVVLVDVDHFKHVNDTHGHEAGDLVLQAVARRLRAAVRTEDVVARWGGEEFLVLAPHTGAGGAGALAERLRSAVADGPVAAGGLALRVTISLGVATAADPPGGVEAVLRAADACLYTAKATGRDRAEAVDLG